MAMRSKIDLDSLYHMDGKFNPTDVGTRPDKITVDGVSPGSISLKGHSWMQRSMEEARKEGIIKHIEDIKLNNENKRVKDGIVFNVFDESDDEAGVYAVCNLARDGCKKATDCKVGSNYLYPPLKRNFTSMVRITSYVILAVTRSKKKLYLKQIGRQERDSAYLEKLEFKEPTFLLFNVLTGIDTEIR